MSVSRVGLNLCFVCLLFGQVCRVCVVYDRIKSRQNLRMKTEQVSGRGASSQDAPTRRTDARQHMYNSGRKYRLLRGTTSSVCVGHLVCAHT